MEKTILKNTILSKQVILFIILFFSTTLFAGNSFVKSKIRKGELNLYFTSDIERVTYFTIPDADGVTKYIYDIHGGVLPSGKGISQHSFRNIESFRMGQNSPEKLRVIIRSKQIFAENHTFSGNVLTIPLIHNGTKGSSAATTKVINTTKVTNTTQKRDTPSPSTTKSSARSNGYIVVIDAGHGGKDNGASCCKVKTEKKVTLSVASKLKKRLEDDGYTVYMTRDDDSFVKLPSRTEFANKKKADIFVSIHANAAPKEKLNGVFKGIEIYYLSPAKTDRAREAAMKENAVMFEGKDQYTTNEYLSLLNREKIVESHKLGLDISKKMLSNVRNSFGKVESGGVKPANFWVLVGAQMPAVLVETGYITHPKEGENLMNNYYKKLLAKGIAEGIERYLKNK
jgi:N-acetylmuramoyl-L-alanine amidase